MSYHYLEETHTIVKHTFHQYYQEFSLDGSLRKLRGCATLLHLLSIASSLQVSRAFKPLSVSVSAINFFLFLFALLFLLQVCL